MPQSSQTDYTNILSEFFQRQIVIFGPQIVHMKIAEIKDLTCDKDGSVRKIEREPQAVLQDVADSFSVLSEYAVKTVLDRIVSAQAQSAVVISPDVSSLNNSEDDVIASMNLTPKT